MPDHRGSRFALEVLFLLALAVGLTLADLQPLEIGGIMLLGWLIVAPLEWAARRNEPHYGSGPPPRYYLPTLKLPPARPPQQSPAGDPPAHRDGGPARGPPAAPLNRPPARPLEQARAGYPEAQRDEAPTWIASAALRAEMLGEWPHSAPVENEAEDDGAPPSEPPVALPPPLLPEPEPVPEPE